MSIIQIERIMKEKNIGATELASILNVNRQTVYYYIKQDDKNSIAQLQKIADALKVDLEELISSDNVDKDQALFRCPKCGTALEVNEKVK